MTLEKICETAGVEFGVCAFAPLRDRLLPCRAAARLPKEPTAVICFAFPYKVSDTPPANISRYAAVEDYHTVCENVLRPIAQRLAEEFSCHAEPFVDNSPIPEVEAASRAGLGVIGDNGLLITKRYGSFVFIGEIVTDMKLDVPPVDPAFCDGCGACRKACPVGLDKTRCLSAVTQKKKPLTEDERQLLLGHGTVWGCDICQENCGKNDGAQITPIDAFLSSYRPAYEKGEDISGRAFEWRGEGVVLRNAEIIEKHRPC